MTENGNLGEPITDRFYEFHGWIKTQQPFPGTILASKPKSSGSHIVPEVPLFIRAFCECFEIFKNPKTLLRLRPMLHVYWC